MGRGILIVFEGIDRCGKSTQVKKLQNFFQGKKLPYETLSFPARQTCIGQQIDKYLSNSLEVILYIKSSLYF